MGTAISISNLETFLLKYVPQLTLKQVLNDALLYKTIIATIDNEGPIVCKFYFEKIEEEKLRLIENEMNKIRSTFNLFQHPNILIYDKIVDFPKKCILLMRQFICNNLKEKLSRIPKITLGLKKWLIFQLLCAVSQIHSEKMVHGDIKSENVLITSYNWLFLADQAPYKPAYIREDDLKNYNMFFGEMDNNQKCYIAPERFKKDYQDSQADMRLLDPAMDIFSVGCIIAEILADGLPLFDLARLQNYRRGQGADPRIEFLKKIKDDEMVNLIMQMTDKDPAKRGTITQILGQWNQVVFPASFRNVYFQIGAAFLRPKFIYSDMKIGLLRKYINSIWYSCFGIENAIVSQNFREPMDPSIFEVLKDDTIQKFEATLLPGADQFEFISHEKIALFYQKNKDRKITQDDKESIIVLIHFLGNFISSSYYVQTKLIALEMLLKVAQLSSIELRLQFILPYTLTLFEDENSKIKAKAIEVTVMMFQDVLEASYVTTLTATDYRVFDNYILQVFLKLKYDTKDKYVQHVFVRYLPLLAQIGHRFLEISISSRLQKQKYSPTKLKQGEDIATTHDTIVSGQSNNNESSINVAKFQEAQEVFVNYDVELDKLRRTIQDLLNDISSDSDTTLQCILLQNLAPLSAFFGRKMTIDNLMPLVISCFNKKDFILRRECMIGIPYLGLRVGAQTLSDFLLPPLLQLLYDSEEIVVLETIKALTKILQFKIIQKKNALDNYDKLLPFLLHPNTWIRLETINYIKLLASPDHKYLTQPEAYCLLRPKLKPYIQKGCKLYDLTGDDLQLSKLKPFLPRIIYNQEIKGVKNEFSKLQPSEQDAIGKMKEVINMTQAYHKSFQKNKTDAAREQNEQFKKSKERIRLYRLVHTQCLNSFYCVGADKQGPINNQATISPNKFKSKKDDKQGEAGSKSEYNKDYSHYCDFNYSPMVELSNDKILETNFNLNKVSHAELLSMDYDLDLILQSLSIYPDSESNSMIQYQRALLFQNLALSYMQKDSNLFYIDGSYLGQNHTALSIEQKQFNKLTLVNQQQQNQPTSTIASAYTSIHASYQTWRPTGRLITTLYEHKSPVTAISVNEDSSMFITVSKADFMINVWSSYDIEKDVTSHSLFTIKHNHPINSITTLENSKYFAVASSQGIVDIFAMTRVESANSNIIKNPSIDKAAGDLNYTSIIKTIEKPEQGDILHCTNMILPIQQEHVLAYVSQKGSLYIHDLRARYDVIKQEGVILQERGYPTCMTVGQDPYSLYIGTLGGYLMIYDLRFNMFSQFIKHSARAPINSIAPYVPSRQLVRSFTRSDQTSPFALIASGQSNYELSLVNLDTGDVEMMMTVDETKNKELVNPPIVPYYQTERIQGEIGSNYETNRSLFSKEVQYYKNQWYFTQFMNEQQKSIIKNLDDEWLKYSKSRLNLVKIAYDCRSTVRKVLCPRLFSNMIQSRETVNYVITGGQDKKIRYWDLVNPKRSFNINTPDDEESKYVDSLIGDVYVVQEKINPSKQFIQVNSQHLLKQPDVLGTQPNNVSLAGNSTYYNIIGNMLNQTSSQPQADDSIKYQNYQYDQPEGGQTQIYNMNGLAEWQNFNGLAMNQGCQFNAQGELVGSELIYRESLNVAHKDCILDMGMLDLNGMEPILITCGRDGLVKLWR